MIDNSRLDEILEEQISAAIEKYISEDFSDDFRKKQLNNIIQRSVEKMTKELLVNDCSKLQEIIVENIKNNSELTSSVLQSSLPHLIDNVEKHVKDGVKDVISNTISETTWQTRIQSSINQIVSKSSSELLSSLDISKVAASTIKDSLHLNDQKLKNIFSGIQDNTKETTELVVMPDYVVVENTLASRNIKNIGSIESECVSVKDLSVTGSINVDNASWQSLADTISTKTLEQLGERFVTDTTDKVLDKAKNTGIEFSNVRLGDQLLVDGNQLSNRITDTKIEKTGTLKSLDVSGNADIFDTLHVVNGRIGVNTDTPDMSLNIWDEETSISIGKISSNCAFIGSNRKHEIALGVNRQGDIVIDADGNTTIKSLRVGRNTIGHAEQVPGWSGTKGDFIINTAPGKDNVFGWVCLGDYRWKTLKSA